MPVEQHATPRIIRLVVVNALTAWSGERKTLQRARQNWPIQIQEWLFLKGRDLSNGGEHSQRILRALNQNMLIATTHSSEAWVQGRGQNGRKMTGKQTYDKREFLKAPEKLYGVCVNNCSVSFAARSALTCARIAPAVFAFTILRISIAFRSGICSRREAASSDGMDS
jgi:hypothetical protein